MSAVQSKQPASTFHDWPSIEAAVADHRNSPALRQQQALELVKRGFAVFPLPFGKKFHRYPWQEVATRNPDEVCAWWPAQGFGPLELPHNIGIACRFSDPPKVIFDVDTGKKDSKALTAFLAASGNPSVLRSTLVHQSSSGGYHVIYNPPQIGVGADGAPIFQKYSNASKLVHSNIDVRGAGGSGEEEAGGYVVAPGSYFDGIDKKGLKTLPSGYYRVCYNSPIATVPEKLTEYLSDADAPRARGAAGKPSNDRGDDSEDNADNADNTLNYSEAEFELELVKLKDALGHISPEKAAVAGHGYWLDVMKASTHFAAHVGCEDAEEKLEKVYNEWASTSSTSYDPEDNKRQWDNFIKRARSPKGRGKPITIRTVYDHAKALGWNPEKWHRRDPLGGAVFDDVVTENHREPVEKVPLTESEKLRYPRLAQGWQESNEDTLRNATELNWEQELHSCGHAMGRLLGTGFIEREDIAAGFKWACEEWGFDFDEACFDRILAEALEKGRGGRLPKLKPMPTPEEEKALIEEGQALLQDAADEIRTAEGTFDELAFLLEERLAELTPYSAFSLIDRSNLHDSLMAAMGDAFKSNTLEKPGRYSIGMDGVKFVPAPQWVKLFQKPARWRSSISTIRRC